jgi:hypothetical protein
MAALALACGVLACAMSRDPVFPAAFVVSVSPDAPAPVRAAADDVAKYLRGMGRQVDVRVTRGETRCEPAVGQVALVGDGLFSVHDLGVVHAAQAVPPGDRDDPSDPLSRPCQRFRIVETRCGDGRVGVHVTLSGGGLLGRQYAAYEWLHHKGVRFFHPEAEFIPDAPLWTDAPLSRDHTPPFQFRSVSLHLTHPLELGDAVRAGRSEYLAEARRYIDWQMKNLASDGMSGVGDPRVSGDLSDWGLRRGFPRSGGLNLHSVQQGGRPILDPDSPLSEEEQLTIAIEARMNVDPSVRPRIFGFTFNPSEFTEIPDLDAVRQMTFIADYMAEHYPSVIINTINHGTHGEPTPHYGVRFYDLPQFAPQNLGVRVHTLMFYDLFRPAPVYGNTSFQFLYDFMVREHEKRRIWYFPEAAWWLTFDIAVPLYLPITIEARDRDIQGISFMLQKKLVGHHTFGTGHEWGYWQNEYCALRLAADTQYRWQDCLADITSPMGRAAPEVRAVLRDVIAQQERDIVLGDVVLPYLVGTDPETEVAAEIGIVFHPLPPSPSRIAAWQLADLDDFERRVVPALERMHDEVASFVVRLRRVEPLVPARARPFFDEILDGIEVTGLRAKHARLVYGAMATARAARLRFDASLAERANTLLAQAKASTAEALAVIRRREAGYRYRPLSRAIAGGPFGADDENWTVYKYRYLNRTHHAYYYTRIDRLAEESISGAGVSLLSIEDALLAPGQPVRVRVDAPDVESPVLAFGDGATVTGSQAEHVYASPGVYEVSLRGSRRGLEVSASAPVAALRSREATGFTARVEEPAGAALIERVLPGIVFGAIDDSTLALGFSSTAAGSVAPDRFARLEIDRAASASATTTRSTRLAVPVVNRDTSAVLASFVVERAVLTLETASPSLKGDLSTQAVVDALVAIGGFEPVGARAIVASTLGFTPDTLPESVPLRVRWTVR